MNGYSNRGVMAVVVGTGLMVCLMVAVQGNPVGEGAVIVGLLSAWFSHCVETYHMEVAARWVTILATGVAMAAWLLGAINT